MNVLFVVVDSLRYDSLWLSGRPSPRTPFLERFDRESTSFRRAYAPECWTLPAHVSFFTGLLPSEHGAHFQTMSYRGGANTLAEILSAQGYATELLTRNSVLDGSIPGVIRGFQRATQVLGEIPLGVTPLLLVLALAKPRVRRLIRDSGFFGLAQKERSSFITTLARMGIPADGRLLERALERLSEHHRRRQPYLAFLNLYDVHAPYSPSETSPLRPVASHQSLLENVALPWVLPKISNHTYLKSGFRMSQWSRAMLLARYHRAIELEDEKLRLFFEAADAQRLLDDTLVVLTSDHGEGFGEHGLYLHDGSLHETHVHVPLWIRVPGGSPAVIDDVVSTRDLFALLSSVSRGGFARTGTLLDPAVRERRPAAFAEHFHYPHTTGLHPRHCSNQSAVITRSWKVIARNGAIEVHDLRNDPLELSPISTAGLDDVAQLWRGDGLDRDHVDAAVRHLAKLFGSESRSSVRRAGQAQAA